MHFNAIYYSDKIFDKKATIFFKIEIFILMQLIEGFIYVLCIIDHTIKIARTKIVRLS